MNFSRLNPNALKVAAVCFVVGCGFIIVTIWPRRIATLRCADGSVLIIRDITFGTKHVWTKRTRGQIVPLKWESETPSMAIWGTWDGRGEHSFRFELVHDVVHTPWAALKTQIGSFGPGQQAGLLATTTRSPGMLLYVRVHEDTQGKQSGPVAEFMVRNHQLVKERSDRPARWSLRLISSRRWTFETRLMIANERTSNEILVEKVYILGPIGVFKTFK